MYRKVDSRETKDNWCLLTLDLGKYSTKHSTGKEFQGIAVQGNKLFTKTFL